MFTKGPGGKGGREVGGKDSGGKGSANGPGGPGRNGRGMRTMLAAAVTAGALSVPPSLVPWLGRDAQAKEPAPATATEGEIVSVIRRQMEALQRDDAAGAFAFASPTIQMMFRTPDNFIAMVRQGYQPVYRPRDVRFLGLETIDGAVTQKVLVVGPDGLTHVALYEMEQQPDGSWRIAGCILVHADEVDA